MKRVLLVFLSSIWLLFVSGCGLVAERPEDGPQQQQEALLPQELRGVWLSFLELEPMLSGADVPTAKARLDEVMDTCVSAGINTVFYHVRAHSDAFYASSVYPAAQAVTALLAQGFDPLAYALEAAHSRELALHAWINPYRIGEVNTATVTEVGATFQKNGVYYYNPGHAAARGLVLAGAREILTGYAVDGIHFDDYFYPAGMAAQGESFEPIPEGMDVGDWRRAQVNSLVSAIYGLTRQHGRVFGISPIALPEKCYSTAFGDVALWMAQPGYVDYICPQIYYGFTHGEHPFEENLAMWAAMPRRQGVALYVGLALYKAGLAEDIYAGSGRFEWAENRDILSRQVQALRRRLEVGGFVLFRYDYLTAPQEASAEERKNLLPLMG